MQDTLASFNLILLDFESEIMTVGSGHGRETRSVRTVLPVPPCTHPEVLAQKTGTANPPRTNVRIHNVTLQSLAQSSDTYGIFDAFFAYVGGAESSGHLGNLCFTHFWFRLPLVASAASSYLPVSEVSFCCVAEERLSDLLPATAAGGHFIFVATKAPCTLRNTLCVFLYPS